jgi:pyridinium-3,5-bisthiocarboxylic acid mononucleotide nickel chelatase
MSKIAYFECPTGVAGDMCLAALLDAGLPMAYLEKQLAKLGLAAEYRLTTSRVRHQGQTANHVDVELLDAEGHLPDFAERSAQGVHDVSLQENHSHPHHHHHHSHPHSPHQHQVLDKEQHYHSPQRNLPVIDRSSQPAAPRRSME